MILTGDTRVFNAQVSQAEGKKLEATMTQPERYVYREQVKFYANYSAFPETGLKGVIYIDESTSMAYWWDESIANYNTVSSGSGANGSNGSLIFSAVLPEVGNPNTVYIDTATGSMYNYNAEKGQYEMLITRFIEVG